MISMDTHSPFTTAALSSFHTQLAARQRLLEQAAVDVATLAANHALESFVSTFLERESDLLDAVLDRLVQGDEPFSKQLESSSDPLEYTDHNGCAWLFDVRKPHLGWV